MPTELQEIQKFFKGYDIPLSLEWLESCIEWCKDGNLPPNYTLEDLRRMVVEQWLNLDLSEVEVPSLPRNLSNEKKYSLTGKYVLQMMQVVDISKPKLWQLQRIRNNVAKNTDAEKDFGKRVLQLTLTDGVQEVEAMEFKPIPSLNINMRPGAKVRITGPVMVRNGRLMLTEENVKYVGGAVDEIRVKYAAENVLARALRLEENSEPYLIDEQVLEVSEANNTTQMNRNANTQNYNAPNQNRNQNQSNQAQPRNTHTQEIPPEFQVDDELLRELEADFEENCIRNTIGPRISKSSSINLSNTKTSTINRKFKSNESDRSRECNSPDLFDEMEVDDELLNEHLDQIDVDHMASNTRSTLRSGISSGFSLDVMEKLGDNGPSIRNQKRSINKVQDVEISSSVNVKTNEIDDEFITLDDSFDDIDIDSHLDNIDEEMANLPSSTQKRNDLKDRVKSPELKSHKISSNSSKNFTNLSSTSLSLKNSLASSKKLTQGTLNFQSSKTDSKNISSSTRVNSNLPVSLNLNSPEPEHENPFSIFKKPPKLPTKCGFSDTPKTSSNLAQKHSNVGSPDFDSKYLPSTSNALSNQPQKSLNIGSPDFESKYLPSTSSTLSNQPQNSGLLSPETCLENSSSSSKIGNILYIEKLKKMLPNIGKGKFKIKGKFKTVSEKLQHTDDGYHFVIVVEDITGDLTVQVHSDLVTNIVGIDSDELGRMRVLALQQDEDVKRQIMEVLSNLHQRCLTLDDVLEIQVTRGEKYPVVINIV